ncbi:Protein RRP5 [Chionoecetes opilio]|uniref:Protein RRP5 n=1 Tax=Chionoecetes opilio TaxID=41210 RepID=A0A8J4YCP5_CHIOP|nr:Protein RRP5 [Chionoecetes opilio]
MTQLKQKRDLFSVKVKKERKGGKKKGKKQTGDKTIKVKKAKKEDRLSSLDVEPLTYKSLAVGQVVLGCICEVRDYGLVVSLPHKLMGSVSLAHISRPYTALLSKLKDDDDNEEDEDEAIHALQELYTCGQYVVASVVAVAKENNMTKVSLTLMPNEVNFGIPAPSLAPGLVVPCAVSSVEDKGYVLDTGIAGISAAFMKKEHTAKADNLRLTFSADPKAVSAATLDLSATTNMALLLPGTAVNTTISKVRHDAVTLMLADLDGVVSPLHLAQPFEQLQQYSLGDSVRARVLYVTPLSKVVHLTLQKTVCSKRSVSDPLQGLECGNIVREAEIYKTSASGIYVRLNAKTRGFCSGNHLSDKNKVLKHITRDFPVGKKHTCRLIKYNFLDQLFIVSLQKSVLEQQFVSYSELAPGQVVEATVSGYEETGARLAVSKVISGHVPALHLTNNPVKHPQRKHPLGQQVTARVLKVNPKRHHLLLTLKSRLVNAQEPIVTQYTREAENTITVGYVIKIIPSGLLVGMFNDVKGFVPSPRRASLPARIWPQCSGRARLCAAG